MGYSFDDSTSTTIVNGNVIGASVTSPNGAHTLHVKSWGNLGASCVTDVRIVVSASPLASVPGQAKVVKNIHKLTPWQSVNDLGAGSGISTGVTTLVSSPSISGLARQFATTYSNSAGHRYSVSFGADTSAKNFLYDAWVNVACPSNDIANLEFDMNQVIGNGDTVI